MEPENVRPANFEVTSIIYNNHDFSIAYGIWDGGDHQLGMRWNHSPDEIGYPKAFGHPMWFMITPDLTFAILKCLIGMDNVDNTKLMEAISQQITK